jgi:hypothetical protein
MVCKLSNSPDGFSLVLMSPQWLEPEQLAPRLALALRVPRADAVRMCRRQRGILCVGVPHEQAVAAAEVLAKDGIEVRLMPDIEVPLLPNAVEVSVAALVDGGLATPSVCGIGMPEVWRYEDLALITSGILMDPSQQAAKLMDTVGEGALADAEDRRMLASGLLERARQRVFPLQAELARDEPQVAEALTAALRGEGKPDSEVPGFGTVSTVVDLVFTRPFERLRLTHTSRVQGIARSRNRARMLHDLLRAVVPRASMATIAGTTLAIQQGADSGEYVFEDLQQFDAYSRWAYWRRLTAVDPSGSPEREGEQS